MFSDLSLWLRILRSLLVSGCVAFFMTPQVRKFAVHVGAVDQPSARRINDHPVPRMGGISIFCGLMLSLLFFAKLTLQVRGIMLGAVIISVMGGLDDIYDLPPWAKFLAQFVAAFIAIRCGVVVDAVTNWLGFGESVFVGRVLSYLMTALWIVYCTNAVNFIDGLDGLAVGMTTISAATLFFISLRVADPNISVILICLIGACLGFLPFNWNPAKIFMGDVGSQMLGFVLSTVSVIGLFKMHALVTMLIPVLAMAVPIADTAFAIIRRLRKGQSPFKADRGHFHHRLLDLGLTQKQVVLFLYSIAIVLGLFAYLMVGSTRKIKIIIIGVTFLVVFALVFYVSKLFPKKKQIQAESSSNRKKK